MKFALLRSRTMAFLAMVVLAGCGSGEGKGADAGESPPPVRNLLPPEDTGVRIVLEAEAGQVEPNMVIEEFQPVRHPDLGLQEASGGKCVLVPKDANKECKLNKTEPKGKVVLEFSVPKEGEYYIYPRVFWLGECWDSMEMSVDGGKGLLVTDTRYNHWHWVKFSSPDETSTAPRSFRLAAGRHTLMFKNREDGTRLDQVYITDDPDDRPTGMKKPE